MPKVVIPIYEVGADGTYQITVQGFGTFNNTGHFATISSLVFHTAADFDVSSGGRIDITATTAAPGNTGFDLGLNADGGTPGLGTLTLGASMTVTPSDTLDFSGTHNSLRIGDYRTLGLDKLTTGMGGWATGDAITFVGSNVISESFNAATHVLTARFAHGSTTLHFASGLGANNFAVANGDIVWACFLRGTRIATPDGQRPVEAIAEGARVLTAKGEAAEVRWVGRRRLDCRSLPHPEFMQPVAVRAGALGDGVPHRDLFLSPDHAVLAGGLLVPVRLLVNGASIVARPDLNDVEYFHIELDRHDLLLAEGAPAESYLEADNRGFFARPGAPVALRPEPKRGAPDRRGGGVMPLAVAPGLVEPIWRTLAERARGMGHAMETPGSTAEPDLRVLAGGHVLRPLRAEGSRAVFALPPACGSGQVVILSRAASPNWNQPWLDDRRVLGVAVSRLALISGGARYPIALDGPALGKGWWEAEQGVRPRRWTDGAAVLRLPRAPGPALLEVELAESIAYPLDHGDQQGRRAA